MLITSMAGILSRAIYIILLHTWEKIG